MVANSFLGMTHAFDQFHASKKLISQLAFVIEQREHIVFNTLKSILKFEFRSESNCNSTIVELKNLIESKRSRIKKVS